MISYSREQGMNKLHFAVNFHTFLGSVFLEPFVIEWVVEWVSHSKFLFNFFFNIPFFQYAWFEFICCFCNITIHCGITLFLLSGMSYVQVSFAPFRDDLIFLTDLKLQCSVHHIGKSRKELRSHQHNWYYLRCIHLFLPLF